MGGLILVVFGCFYEGKVVIECIFFIVEWYRMMGVEEIFLVDIIGMVNF